MAEVSRANARGHTYFRLCEPSPGGMGQPLAVIDCALFAGNRPDVVRSFAREGQVFQLMEGMTLRVQGRVSLWDRGGRYQLIVEAVDPSWSMGDQARKLRRLVDKLRREGVLEANSELSMPLAPLRVGLITSRDSAAAQDFLQSLIESRYPFRVYAAWASMQGENTAGSVIEAFNRLLGVGELDAVVLTRGGGSSTDLAWFNDERIAGVISQVPWPVVSGIGHETDTTLPDFAAHTSVKTPTRCAEFLINRLADFAANVDALASILHRSATRRTAAAREKLASLAAVLSRSGKVAFRLERRQLETYGDLLARGARSSITRTRSTLEGLETALFRLPETGRIGKLERELDGLQRSLVTSAGHRLSLASARLESLEASVRGNDPGRLYRRGWATVRNSSGELVRSIEDTSLKELLLITLRDGAIHARTEKVVPEGSDDE